VVTGHQCVYLPWLGLIHKASLADVFVYMDDVQYLEQDWNNRNYVKTPQGKAVWLTVPVDLKNSKTRLLKDIQILDENLAADKKWTFRHWNTLKSCYGKSRHFKDYKPFFEWLYLEKTWEKLSVLNLAILRQIFSWFKLDAEIVTGSSQHFTKIKSDLVLEHALYFHADVVVTGILGKNYILESDFAANQIHVIYQDYQHPVYPQRFGPFLPRLSFVDLLFNCGPESRDICLSGNLKRDELECLTLN
jgi:hypothetical protein